MTDLCLPNLEATVTQLVVELLLIEKEQRFPHLLMGDTEDKTATRATMHYVRALHAYGFSPENARLNEVIDWFDRPFPERRNDHIDPQEMNRLLILLLTRPDSDYVVSRLGQLWDQQVEDGFDVQPGWGGYDTLWALEVFALAKKQGVLPADIIKWERLAGFLDQLITGRDLPRDKDLALALHLQHQYFGGLSKAHLGELDRLIAVAAANHGVWGLGEIGWLTHRMDWLEEFVGKSKLLPQEVREFQSEFRRIVLSTSMVVEYLAPLRTKYRRLQQPLEQAMGLWWLQFEGDHAMTTLRSLFPKPRDFDYLRVLCRTLRATCAYIGQPPGTINDVQIHVLHELAEMKKDLSESLAVRNIKEALRYWIRVELERDLEPLKLGFSEANVVRVRPYIWSPVASANEGKPLKLDNESIIIKYGPRDEIEQERGNYEKLPAPARDPFVRIPEATYTHLESGIAYVIMQDLHDYETLYEARTCVTRDNVHMIARQLSLFLERMHEGESRDPRQVSKSLLREIYLRKMMEYIDRIFDFAWDYEVFHKQPMVSDIQQELFEQIGILIQRQADIRDFPATYMHGDLHMRNIMIRGLENRTQDANIRFKLIDLEYLETAGDAAFDAGQLLVDLDLVARDEVVLDSQKQLERLRDHLEQTYLEFGRKREDSLFGVRMELAKARALLRIGKGKTKRGSRYLKEKQSAQAEQIAEDVLSHASEALHYLRAVTTHFR